MANTSKVNLKAVMARLQPSPVVMTELLEAFREADPDLDRIVQLIAVEPSLKAAVLRRSNSVMFSNHAPAGDVFEAVSRIGMYEAYSAVSAIAPAPAVTVPAPRGAGWR